MTKTADRLPDGVRAILEAESLRGARTTFVIRLVLGALGVLGCLVTRSANTPTATRIGIITGALYLAFSAMALDLMRRKLPTTWLRYAGCAADATVVTAVSLTGLFNYSGAYETLLAPLVGLLYVMFIMLTGLQYSPRLPVFAGFTAAAERGAVFLWLVSHHLVSVSPTAIYGERAVGVSDQIAVVVFVAGSGLLAAWIARNARALLVTSAMDAVRKRELERREQQYSRYLSAPTLEHVLDHPGKIELGGERRSATVLVAALHDLGALAETRDPEVVVDLLNQHLSELTEIVLRYGGTVDRFLGEGLVALFGLPYEIPDPPGSAVRAAIEMHERIQGRSNEVVNLQIGVGIAQGVVIAGNIGSTERMEHTVLGPALSRAQRLQASSLIFGPVLVDESVYDAIRGMYRTRTVSISSATGLRIPTYAIEFGVARPDSGSTLLSAG